ncbi:MAG TPA: class I SAM-dependent methyltransferase [Anaerolineales bacterium]
MPHSDSERGHPLLDVGEFWREHDRALPQHKHFGNVALSHDLYRGMPPWFNAYYAHFQRRAVLRLLRQCVLLPGIRALDVGCGTGRWSELMLSRGWEPYGIDMGKQALRYAAEAWPETRFTCGMLPSLCFADESFDLAVSVTVLQHVPHAQQRESVDAIYRALKPGGHFVVIETIDTSDPSPHIFGNTFENWWNLFGKAGFRIVTIAGSEYLPHVRVFHWLRSKRKASHVSTTHSDVSAIAQLLAKRPLLVALVWLGIAVSYPLEYVASVILPARWARLGCFLLEKA